MEVKILEKDKTSLSLVLGDADASFTNAIRRAIISEVPTLAIENVDFLENTSSLYDEMIVHRLGLIPIKTDLEIFNFREECSCKNGCSRCTLKLSLSKEGPCVVYSQDIKSEDSKLKPIEGVPILKLGKSQKISIEAEAILGTGKEHAKWQPAVVSYKYYPEIEIADKCDLCGECVTACPKDILSIEKKKVKISDEKKCNLCNSCVEACELDAIKVIGNDRKFIIKIESTGALKPEEIFTKSCEILQEKAKKLRELL
ncbi:MAG: DNA-directed RNA polymerase subunit D [Methanobacteriota archaeon]